jgi:hypothetical protein
MENSGRPALHVDTSGESKLAQLLMDPVAPSVDQKLVAKEGYLIPKFGLSEQRMHISNGLSYLRIIKSRNLLHARFATMSGW